MAVISFRKDHLGFGMALGFLAPLLGFLAYYFIRFYPTFGFSEYLRALGMNKPLLTGISTISLVANVILFTIYINTRRDQTAKGIFVVSLLYGIIVLLYKVIA
ncbi:hypothetical protein [Parasegetibacter sp. NRK P23]|uniref:hypothetical protein n=1 Tax=Parasegetibacter sp. NRK P23 TaxID=2942999 RepID=UPI0020440859|nr:hypothetical protein [Parasegetibacter sp. NRK P23]MCM5527136.1 hypothetical protein [Parasegetibacter sp. NRK P23]